MREAQLARPRVRAASDQRHVRNGVMRRPERPRPDEPRPARKQAGHRVDGRDLERFGDGERRQDARQAPRHHRLAGPGWPGQQDVMAAGRRDFERPAGHHLPANVREVAPRVVVFCTRVACTALVTPFVASVAERRGRLVERLGRPDAQPVDNRRLGGVRRGNKRGPDAGPGRGHRDGQHAAGGPHRSVERERSHDDDIRVGTRGQRAGGREDAERDGEVVRRALLAHVRRREVDGDVLPRKLEIRVPDRRPDPVAALAHAGVRQPDDREGRQPRRHVHLDAHDAAVDAGERGAEQRGEHARHGCKAGSSGRIARFAGNSAGRARCTIAVSATAGEGQRGRNCHASLERLLARRRAGRIDGEPVPRHEAIALQPVPRTQGGHRGVERAGDRGERVAALHAIRDPVQFSLGSGCGRRLRVGRRGRGFRDNRFRAGRRWPRAGSSAPSESPGAGPASGGPWRPGSSPPPDRPGAPSACSPPSGASRLGARCATGAR